jgi:hypothetical protein
MTTTTEVPTWLNLDAICPPEVVAQLQSAADGLEELLPLVDEKCEAAYRAVLAYGEAVGGRSGHIQPFEVWDVVDKAVGRERISEAAYDLGVIAICATDDADTEVPGRRPAWYVKPDAEVTV